MSEGKISPIFWIESSDVNGLRWRKWCAETWRRLRNVHILLHVRSQRRQPSPFGHDTHAVVSRPTWAPERGLHTQCGLLCRWVDSLAHRHVLATRTRAKVNVRPRPLVEMTGNKRRRAKHAYVYVMFLLEMFMFGFFKKDYRYRLCFGCQ